ncbi:MAG TPA: AsmA-like C-terminal region-containing protein [Pirellulales bacterium]|nr:AsmA-like C-terminal region-containing protein [Pirellulales bacterium]
MKDLINTCWFVFKWGLLAALLAAVGLALYFYSRVNDEIRQQVLAKWQAHYPNLIVSLRSAQLGPEGIEIRGLTLLDPRATGPQAELAYLDEIMLYCQTSLPELLQGEPKFTRAVVRRPMVRATRRQDGSWSAALLLPLPKFSKYPIAIAVENGTLEFFNPLKNPISTFTLRDINLQTKPVPSTDPGGEPSIEVSGNLAGDHFQNVEVAGMFNPGFKGFDIHGLLTGLDVSPELRDALPSDLAERTALLAPLHGQARIGFHVRDNPAGPNPLLFDAQGELSGGRFDHPRLPNPLTDLTVSFRADNRGIVIDKLTASNGPATLWLKGTMDGFSPGAPLSVSAHTENLLLGRQWERILPEPLLTTWRKFLPAGEVDADLNLDFDGHSWRPDLAIRCRNVSLTYYRFPYRLDRTSGLMTLKDNHMSLKLIGYAASQRIDVAGKFDNPGDHFTGEVEIQGKNLPFDQNLFAALPEKQSEVLTSLHPGGTFDFYLRNGRTDPAAPMSPYLAVTLNHGSVQYDRFPYPISNIRGTLVMSDKQWTFRDLAGTNGPGHITCDGFLNPVGNDPGANGWELQLNFGAQNVPLQDDLCEALNAQSQRAWKQLNPHGAINLKAELHYLTASKTPEIQFRAEPVDETTSIEPVMFPYKLERLKGALVYHEGRIDIEGIRAVHAGRPVETSGYCEFDRQGNWHLRFDRLSVDHLRADRDLIEALSGRLKKCVVALNPTGSININNGMLEFFGSATPGSPTRAGWNLPFNIIQGIVGNGIRIENINGNVRLIGECDGQQAHSHGFVDIDSLTFKDFQFTKVQGPFWVDEKRVVFGSAAEQSQPGQPPHRMTAQLYGGFVQTDCAIALGDTPRYSLQAVLTDADLKRFAHETVPGKQRLDGRVMASIDLGGDTNGMHSLSGRGEVRLTQADIYQLPFMVSLLKLLSVKPPDSTAFTKSTIDYRIEGDHVYFNKIAFIGDAISLEGSGEMNFDTAINLTFHSQVGRSDWELPVFKAVMGAASRQILLIHVAGTLADPRMTREVLPGVSKALQQVQDNMQSGSQPPIYPQARAMAPAR